MQTQLCHTYSCYLGCLRGARRRIAWLQESPGEWCWASWGGVLCPALRAGHSSGAPQQPAWVQRDIPTLDTALSFGNTFVVLDFFISQEISASSCVGVWSRVMDFQVDFRCHFQRNSLPVVPWLTYNELLFARNEMVFLFLIHSNSESVCDH